MAVLNARGISEEDKALLYFCMTNLRDLEIAARLFISVRTFHRRLDRLMTLAGARTRFGLGAHATKLGWIDPESALHEPSQTGFGMPPLTRTPDRPSGDIRRPIIEHIRRHAALSAGDG